jgi:hypothetical protein
MGTGNVGVGSNSPYAEGVPSIPPAAPPSSDPIALLQQIAAACNNIQNAVAFTTIMQVIDLTSNFTGASSQVQSYQTKITTPYNAIINAIQSSSGPLNVYFSGSPGNTPDLIFNNPPNSERLPLPIRNDANMLLQAAQGVVITGKLYICLMR